MNGTSLGLCRGLGVGKYCRVVGFVSVLWLHLSKVFAIRAYCLLLSLGDLRYEPLSCVCCNWLKKDLE